MAPPVPSDPIMRQPTLTSERSKYVTSVTPIDRIDSATGLPCGSIPAQSHTSGRTTFKRADHHLCPWNLSYVPARKMKDQFKFAIRVNSQPGSYGSAIVCLDRPCSRSRATVNSSTFDLLTDAAESNQFP